MNGSRVGERAATGMRATVRTVLASTVLAVVKILSGWIGNSYALIADGVESVLDVFSSLVVWSGLRIAARPPDDNHPYGHGKAESLAAMVVAVVLLGASAGLAIQSVREIITPHHAPAPFTLAVLLTVVVVKEWIYRGLSGVAGAIDSTAIRVDAWHHRSDALTSAAAFVGIGVALVGGPGWEEADDWAALFACSIIAWNGSRLLKTAVADVMDTAGPVALERSIRELASVQEGVVAIEKCLVRKSGPAWLVDIHVEVSGRASVVEGHRIGHRVKDALLASEFGVLDVLVHIEPANGGDGRD